MHSQQNASHSYSSSGIKPPSWPAREVRLSAVAMARLAQQAFNDASQALQQAGCTAPIDMDVLEELLLSVRVKVRSTDHHGSVEAQQQGVMRVLRPIWRSISWPYLSWVTSQQIPRVTRTGTCLLLAWPGRRMLTPSLPSQVPSLLGKTLWVAEQGRVATTYGSSYAICDECWGYAR